MTDPFVPGLELSRAFYEDAVRPIVEEEAPGLEYAAALVGNGSEVLGFDTSQSTDHHWGPRLLLFLREDDLAAYAARLDAALRERLPPSFAGYPTSFGAPDEIGVRLLEPRESGPVDHMVAISSVGTFLRHQLGFDPAGGIGLVDWLATPQQAFLSVTAGAVYHDGVGELTAARAALEFYPYELWLHVLAVQWDRIGQTEAFVGRCAAVGDVLGEHLVADGLVRGLVGLCFLMERRYAPYAKWLGSAFQRLEAADRLLPVLVDAVRADEYAAREASLSEAYRLVVQQHNALGVTGTLSEEVTPYHSRPYLVIGAPRFAEALRRAVADDEVRALPPWLGAVDQMFDTTDLPQLVATDNGRRAIRALYDAAR